MSSKTNYPIYFPQNLLHFLRIFWKANKLYNLSNSFQNFIYNKNLIVIGFTLINKIKTLGLSTFFPRLNNAYWNNKSFALNKFFYLN